MSDLTNLYQFGYESKGTKKSKVKIRPVTVVTSVFYHKYQTSSICKIDESCGQNLDKRELIQNVMVSMTERYFRF